MTISVYDLCPCGSGKKLKFCCHEMQAELDKITKMIGGNQRQATLDYLVRLEGKHPGQPALLAIKAELQAASDDLSEFHQTAEQFVRLHPENRLAHAESAISLALQGEPTRAADELQTSLEGWDAEIPYRFYQALSLVASSFVQHEQFLPGMAHLRLQAGMAREQRPVTEMLTRIMGAPELPLLLKDLLRWPRLGPHDGADQAAWLKIEEAIGRALWRSAARQLTALAAAEPKSPAIWQPLAILRGWLGDDAGAAAAWRQLAALDVPADEAIEAEAAALLLDRGSQGEVEFVSTTYPVADLDALESRLAGERRLDRLADVDPDEHEGPPPKAEYWLLDRPLPTTGLDLTRDAAPLILGNVFLYGKQTDRPARVVLSIWRDGQFDARRADFRALTGDLLGPPEPLKPAGDGQTRTSTEHATTWSWRLPDDTPEQDRARLYLEQQRHVLLEVWPAAPQASLGGKSPRQAAADPAGRRKVQALLLLEELRAILESELSIYDELRSALDLPPRETLHPTTEAAIDLPLVRYLRIDPAGLPDGTLMDLLNRAALNRAEIGGRRFFAEFGRRPSLADRKDVVGLCGLLADWATGPDEAIDFLGRGREAAKKFGISPAGFELREMFMRFEMGQVAEFEKIFLRIRKHHLNEPGVAESLYRWMASVGMIGPDGQMRQPARDESALVLPSGAAEPGKLWTPEGATAEEGGKKLWMPGME